MSLSLPEGLEPYLDDYDQLHAPGAYALHLERPTSLADVWDSEYEERPPYWSELMSADRVIYVGGTGDLLSRLEDHRDGDVRQTALTRVCEVVGLHTAWPTDSAERAFNIIEPRLARWLQSSRPDVYVHCR